MVGRGGGVVEAGGEMEGLKKVKKKKTVRESARTQFDTLRAGAAWVELGILWS